MTHEVMAKILRFETAYSQGVEANRLGLDDNNPYSMGSPMEFCAWSAGYFDSMRGMV